jgi:hypothetical protein
MKVGPHEIVGARVVVQAAVHVDVSHRHGDRVGHRVVRRGKRREYVVHERQSRQRWLRHDVFTHLLASAVDETSIDSERP